MEERAYKKKTIFLVALSIVVAALVTIGIAVYQKAPTETIPAILEDSISDKTNTFIDTISGKAPIDSAESNQPVPSRKIPD